MAENNTNIYDKKIIDLDVLAIVVEEMNKNIADSQQIYVGSEPPQDSKYIFFVDEDENADTPIDLISMTEKLSNIEDNANNYVHPVSHDASMITQDATHRFVSDTEKSNWNSSISISNVTTYEPLESNNTATE